MIKKNCHNGDFSQFHQTRKKKDRYDRITVTIDTISGHASLIDSIITMFRKET